MAGSDPEQFIEALRSWAEAFMRQSMHGAIQYAKQNHMSMSQLGAMLHISRMGACAVADISEDLGVTSAAVSQLVDRLVDQGLVSRDEDPADRRAKRIELTARGTKVLQQAMEARQAWFRALASSLTAAERAAAAATLRSLTERTLNMEGTGP